MCNYVVLLQLIEPSIRINNNNKKSSRESVAYDKEGGEKYVVVASAGVWRGFLAVMRRSYSKNDAI